MTDQQFTAPLTQDETLDPTEVKTEAPLATSESTCSIRLLQFLSLLCVLLFSGILFGWQSLLLVLQRDGAYHELCEDGTPTDEICSEQKAALNLVFTIGSTMLSVIALPAGLFIDRYGPCISTSVSGACVAGGLCLLGLSDSQSFPAFTPAYCLLAIGGLLLMFAAFRCAFLPGANPAMVMAGVSCLFDASCVIFLIFEFAENHSSLITLRNFMLAYGILAAMLMSLLTVLWSQSQHYLEAIQLPELSAIVPAASLPLSERSLTEQLRSFEFVVLLVYASVSLTRANLYIGTQDIQLEYLGDDNNLYAKIFSLVLPCGPVMVPVIELCDSKCGAIWSLHITTALGAAYNSLALVNSLDAQIPTFALYTFYRAFLYSVLAAFAADRFGMQTLGRIQGTVFTIAGIFNLIQYGLVALVQGPLEGDPFYVNVGQLVVLVPLVVLVEMLRRRTPWPDSTPLEWSDQEDASPQLSPNMSPRSCPVSKQERPFLARMCSGSGSPSLQASKWKVLSNHVQGGHVVSHGRPNPATA